MRERKNKIMASLVGLALVATGGCATARRDEQYRALSSATERRRAPEGEREAGAERAPEGSLASYVAFAIRHHPGLEADFERWRAATHVIGSSRRAPPLTISYMGFVRAIETRVGPQRGRLGIRQSIPWPSTFSAATEAASYRSEAAQRRFEARLLGLQASVAEAYWRLWLVGRIHALEMSQDGLLEGLSSAVRSRMELGHASLGDLAAVELRLARHRDHHQAHREARRIAEARLRVAVGATALLATPVELEAPAVSLPAEGEGALLEAALRSPRVTRHQAMAQAMNATAEGEEATRLPSFGVGFDWIQIGEAPLPIPESGRDAVALSVSMSVPLFQGAGREGARAARATAAALRADERAERDIVSLALELALSRVRETRRRVNLHSDAFIPQAETAYASQLGGYPLGRSSLADLVLAQTQLIELQIAQAELTAQYAVAWASLEEIVGRPVRREESTDER